MPGSLRLSGWRNIAAITCSARTLCAIRREKAIYKTIVNDPGEARIHGHWGEKQKPGRLGSMEKYSCNPAGTEASQGAVLRRQQNLTSPPSSRSIKIYFRSCGCKAP